MSVNLVNKDTGELTLLAGATMYADAPIGSIQAYGGITAPTGWLLCQGQAVSRTTYSELFAVIGTNYGSGDGSSTFNLPKITQLNQSYAAKTQIGAWTSNLEDGSESTTWNLGAGYYYIEIVLSNASLGKTTNTVSITKDNKLISNFGYIGAGADLKSQIIYLDGGTYVVTHICRTAGIGGSAVVNLYNTTCEPVGSYIIKAQHTPVPTDFMDAVNEAMNECKILPYEFNRSSNISAFNRKFVYDGNPITWTATHTGRLTIRLIKHGDGYSLYLQNQNNVMLDSYDNFLGTNDYGTAVTDTSITLQAWVRKGDIITLTSNIPASTDWDDKFFVQTGLLAYNDNFD